MAAASPSPNSSPSAIPPADSSATPSPFSPPPPDPQTPTSQPNANPPNGTSLSPSPATQPPPPANQTSPLPLAPMPPPLPPPTNQTSPPPVSRSPPPPPPPPSPVPLSPSSPTNVTPPPPPVRMSQPQPSPLRPVQVPTSPASSPSSTSASPPPQPSPNTPKILQPVPPASPPTTPPQTPSPDGSPPPAPPPNHTRHPTPSDPHPSLSPQRPPSPPPPPPLRNSIAPSPRVPPSAKPPKTPPPPPSGPTQGPSRRQPKSPSSPASRPASRPNSVPTPPDTPLPTSPPQKPGARISPPSAPSVPPPDNGTPTTNSSRNKGIGTGGAVTIALLVGLFSLGIVGIIMWCTRNRRKKVSGLYEVQVNASSVVSSPKSESALLRTHISPAVGSGSGSDLGHTPREPGELGNSRSWFTFHELVDATNGFSTQNLLGEGGFGYVYKGCLADGTVVAVKRLKIGGGQGEREFRSEVEIISRIHHRHLVQLVGYCISENQRLLVYEYVSNKTLYFHLHGEGLPVMDWATRVKIAIGAARGIAYLHEDCHPRVIHRDIKSSNILLNDNFDARVSDFGLAKLTLDANTHVTTRVMGTFGYMAPEYASSGKLTEKSDVFSFGVVLLELITGRKPVDPSQPLGEESLVEWARPLLSNALEAQAFEGLTDPRLERNYIPGEMYRIVEAAAACVRHSSAKRPHMVQVVRALDDMAPSDLTNGMKLGQSEIYNSAEQSAEIRWFQRMAFGSQNFSTDFFSQSGWDDTSKTTQTSRKMDAL